MSEIGDAPAARALTLKIDSDALSNLAWRGLAELVEEELSKSSSELSSIAEAEFYVAIKKALAHKCSRIVIEIETPADA